MTARCRAASPTLAVGPFEFQGGSCNRGWPHLGPHANRDGTTWHSRVVAWLVLAVTLAGAVAYRAAVGRWPT